MPNKKQKSQPKNGFFYFMRDYKEQEERAGNNITMNEAAQAVGADWQKMSTKDRQPYESRAARNKTVMKNAKFNSLGENIDHVRRREQEEENNKRIMKKYIEDIVADGSDFASKPFFVGQVNHYCFCNSQNRHIPAEISIAKFSLQDGVYLTDIFHVILDTGAMPIGYLLAATTVSEETHLIPIPPHEGPFENTSEKNIGKSFFSMIDFLRRNLDPQDPLPPVYVDDANMEMAKDVFQNLHYNYDGNNPQTEISVYSLSYLFFVLRNAAHLRMFDEPAFPYPTIPQAELEKDLYDSVRGTACKYHNLTEAYPHCTLSKCIRKIFIICDHTCSDLGIKVIPGKHVPSNSNATKLIQRPLSQISQASAMTNDNSRPSSSLSSNEFRSVTAPRTVKHTVGASGDNSGKNEKSDEIPMRLPRTRSIAQVYNSDFPALGATKPSATNRPSSFGRGRGRILENFASK